MVGGHRLSVWSVRGLRRCGESHPRCFYSLLACPFLGGCHFLSRSGACVRPFVSFLMFARPVGSSCSSRAWGALARRWVRASAALLFIHRACSRLFEPGPCLSLPICGRAPNTLKQTRSLSRGAGWRDALPSLMRIKMRSVRGGALGRLEVVVGRVFALGASQRGRGKQERWTKLRMCSFLFKCKAH